MLLTLCSSISIGSYLSLTTTILQLYRSCIYYNSQCINVNIISLLEDVEVLAC